MNATNQISKKASRVTQAEAEQAALVAVADAAGEFAPYANAENSAPNGKQLHLAKLQFALDSLAAVRGESKVAK